jgi:uncharacterized membrane protein YgcG
MSQYYSLTGRRQPQQATQSISDSLRKRYTLNRSSSPVAASVAPQDTGQNTVTDSSQVGDGTIESAGIPQGQGTMQDPTVMNLALENEWGPRDAIGMLLGTLSPISMAKNIVSKGVDMAGAYRFGEQVNSRLGELGYDEGDIANAVTNARSDYDTNTDLSTNDWVVADALNTATEEGSPGLIGNATFETFSNNIGNLDSGIYGNVPVGSLASYYSGGEQTATSPNANAIDGWENADAETIASYYGGSDGYGSGGSSGNFGGSSGGGGGTGSYGSYGSGGDWGF